LRKLRNIKNLIKDFINWLHVPFRNIVPQETFRYGVAGGFNTSLDIFLYFVTYNYVLKKNVLYLYFIAIKPHIAAFLIVFPVTFTSGFLLSKYITFTESELRGRIQLIRYGITVLVCIILNYIFLKIFVEYFGFYPTASKILTTCLVVIYSYFSQKYFTFKTEGSLISNKAL
jgi:putative flippase GtrA